MVATLVPTVYQIPTQIAISLIACFITLRAAIRTLRLYKHIYDYCIDELDVEHACKTENKIYVVINNSIIILRI